MIGSGLKKLAVENGMTVARGVAYGNLHGYAATLSEGNGYKQIVLTTCFSDPEKLQTLQTQINQQNISREFRVANLSFAPNGVSVVFRDNPGTMKMIQAFIDWFFPLLDQAGASGWDICTECGNQITGGCWKLIDGIAFHLHESCADRVVRGLNEEEQQRKDEDTGTYLSGAVGALIGALIGAIVWAIVLNFGYVASIVGLLIGFLAEKGYNLLKGKQGKGKVVVLIAVIVIGVLVGTFCADAFTLVGMINDGELYGLTYGDIPVLILALLAEDAEYARAVGSNVLMGLLFAGIGVFSLLRKTGKAVSGTKVVDL